MNTIDEENVGRQYGGRLLKEHIDRFPEARVLVIGDIIMDEYIWGEVSRISPEAPVPVVVPAARRDGVPARVAAPASPAREPSVSASAV